MRCRRRHAGVGRRFPVGPRGGHAVQHRLFGGRSDSPSALIRRFWTVEVALPLQSLAQNNDATSPPKHGDFWRINFSRVEWHVTVVNGRYQKDPKYPEEDNWVWSPQGQVAMHLPEKWGMLQFSTEAPRGTPAVHNPEVCYSPPPLRQMHWFRGVAIYGTMRWDSRCTPTKGGRGRD